MMCRFKQRLIGDIVDAFLLSESHQKKQAAELAIKALESCNTYFSSPKGRSVYLEALSAAFKQMNAIPGVSIDLGEMSERELSALRLAQVQNYMQRIVRLWKELDLNDRDKLFQAISESIWPYYSVIYKTKEPADKEKYTAYNWASWGQDSNLLTVPYISRINPLTPPLNHLCLYPSFITGGPDISGVDKTEALGSSSNPFLKKLLDRSSEAFLDFDEPEDTVGLVQRVTIDLFKKKFDSHGLILDHSANNIEDTGLFTDFFHFINESVRYVLTDEDLENDVPLQQDSSVPRGLLFLCGPSVNACCVLNTQKVIKPREASAHDTNRDDEPPLKRSMRVAWNAVGGGVFTLKLQSDMRALRETLINQLISDELRTRAIELLNIQDRAWAHDIKHWTDPPLDDLYFALRDIPDNSEPAQQLKRARLHIKILNATANARQSAIAQQSTRNRAVPLNDRGMRYFGSLTRPTIIEVINLVLEVLLQTHAENPANKDQFILRWPKSTSLEAALNRLCEILPERTRLDIYSVISEPSVLWPLMFFREVVHNIKINDPVELPDDKWRTINIEFQSAIVGDDLLFHVTQRNFEVNPRRIESLPNGLLMTNALYGREGANVGLIDEQAKLTNRPEKKHSAFHVKYRLSGRLFLPKEELQNA